MKAAIKRAAINARERARPIYQKEAAPEETTAKTDGSDRAQEGAVTASCVAAVRRTALHRSNTAENEQRASNARVCARPIEESEAQPELSKPGPAATHDSGTGRERAGRIGRLASIVSSFWNEDAQLKSKNTTII